MFEYDVTVVIPVYNSEKFIVPCVDSLVNQTLAFSRIEVILINDGSPDDSDSVCREISDKYENIKYIYKENSGVSDTRNQGIKIAKGKYIMLLDSDDYLEKYTIKNLFDFFEVHYDEIDLVTYPIYWDREGSISLHPRYSHKNYTKGTGVYDLDEYPHLNQSTVNIMFKNEFENNLLYDTSMKLSEDQNFNTTLLMRKNKMGFVKKAIYYYRRYGGGVSQTKNNPYYCFDDIMSYNEGLLERFVKNGKTPKYIQTLIINTFNWRVGTDELLPYHLEGDEYNEGVLRIKNILNKIDDDVIIHHSNCDDLVKVFFLKWKGTPLFTKLVNKEMHLCLETGEVIYKTKMIKAQLYRTRFNDGKIEIFASLADPILEIHPIDHITVQGMNSKGESFKEDLKFSNISSSYRNTKMPTAHCYFFNYILDPKDIKSFSFKVTLEKKVFNLDLQYIRFCGFIRKYWKNSRNLGDYRLTYHRNAFKPYFSISNKNVLVDFVKEVKSIPLYPIKNLVGILSYRSMTNTNRNIWLYTDSPGVIDNAYYQFIHDFDKNDGVERYYVVDGDTDYLKNRLTPEQMKYVVKHKSKKHKQLFLGASKILISFSSLSIYSPFKDLKWYIDKLHYELVYLQHGILHASLQRMYSKEYTQIDKFIISSKFERDNLIKNYNYFPHDFIVSGMPRMGVTHEAVEVKNKILFAPSWRQYLIGQLINNRRELREKDFLSSDFFHEINDFLHSKELNDLLEENNLELDFKLHPIFKEYRKYFEVDDLKRVDINFEKTILDEYKIFITDFSSYQFDYVKLVRPILYFLPDPIEMRSGIHSYRNLDLKYDDAFGPLSLTSKELLKELQHIIENDYVVDEPYKERMENFFTISNQPCQTIYEELINKK